MKRIFLTLAVLANLTLCYAVWRGLNIGDVTSASLDVQRQVGLHMLIGLGSLTFATLVHAIALTYFMGTGRFLEETTNAYSLPPKYFKRSHRLKYRMIPGMVVCLLLLVSTGALGAVADTATPASLDGVFGLSGARIHLIGAVMTLLVNMAASLFEYLAVCGNCDVIENVLAAVRRIRVERGLPVE